MIDEGEMVKRKYLSLTQKDAMATGEDNFRNLQG